MNSTEIELPSFIIREFMRCEVGSTAHGVSLPGNDDLDLLGVCIESPAKVFGLHHFEHFIYRTAAIREGKQDARSMPGDIDLTVYSLRKFAAMLAKGNPTIMMLLFAPIVSEPTSEALWIRSQSHVFKSKRAGRAFLGYMMAQRRKLEEGQNPSHGKRDYLIEKYGFDTKFAMHMLRLGAQGREFMETGEIKLPMIGNAREFLINVRNGLVPLGMCLDVSRVMEEDLKIAIDKSQLPEHPDEEAIAELVQEMYLSLWHHEGLI